MTIYEKLQQAAEDHQRRWHDLDRRMMTGLGRIVHAFETLCAVPKGQDGVIFSRWDGNPPIDGKRVYRVPDDGGVYTFLGAVRFDPEDGFWRLGVRLVLSQNIIPMRSSFFVLTITERKGKTILISPADSQEREVNLNDPQEVEAFAKTMADSIERAFSADPLTYLRAGKNEIGFHVYVGSVTSP